MDNNAVSFEENYIFRNNRSITSNNDIALTEFVANAWDAGAHNVDITIPFEEHEKIVVEDDGTGITDEEQMDDIELRPSKAARQGCPIS